MEEVDKLVRQLLVSEVTRRLVHCNVGQRMFFRRLYPEGLDKMDERQLRTALAQVIATQKKNEAKEKIGLPTC